MLQLFAPLLWRNSKTDVASEVRGGGGGRASVCVSIYIATQHLWGITFIFAASLDF